MSRAPSSDRRSSGCVVYHGRRVTRPALAGSASWRPAAELFDGAAHRNAPAVLLLDRTLHAHIPDLANLPRHLVIVAADTESDAALGDAAHLSLLGSHDERAEERVLRTACELAAARVAATRRRRQRAQILRELRELRRIGTALMVERDHEALLHQIVAQGKRLTGSDGGGIFLLETPPRGLPRLRLALHEIDSLPDVPSLTTESTPLDDTSIIGHACVVRQPVVIDDAYELPPDAVFKRNPEFDRRYGYRVRSMLIVPMIDHRDGLVGALVFVNRKTNPDATIRSKEAADRYVLRYTPRQVRLAWSLAGDAAVSIENARLHAQVENILECFVKAAVTAIDQRDPTTAGHSMRVAALTTDLAAAVERSGRAPYRDVRFSREQMRELHFAALLHDFGKITVREDVLRKAKKLPPVLSERVEARFDLIRRTLDVEYHKQREGLLRSHADAGAAAALEREFAERVDRLEHMRSVVRVANEPMPTAGPTTADLLAIARHSFERTDGSTAPYLTSDELHFLRIPCGTLDSQERAEIESHVEETYRFLTNIPWTDDLKNLAAFAYAHHEKLNGTGYPRRMRGNQIPIQARIMTIADIFDALTASDRPYKRAVSHEEALDIIRSEARAGQLDVELVNIMVDSQVYRRILEEDWRRF